MMMGYLTSLYLNSPYSAHFLPYLKLADGGSRKLASPAMLTLQECLKTTDLIISKLLLLIVAY